MKKCPHCKEKFNFIKFLMFCGSDTLVPHPSIPGLHRTEHICPQCKQPFWLEFHNRELKREVHENAGFLIIFGMAVFLCGYLFFKMSVLAAALLTVIVAFFIWPFYVGWIKYESSRIKGVEEFQWTPR